ncbi:hypothetical protein [Spiroplasma poulsonii]|uniref:Uncharacterized protein n=1 Tax=Spiroplasma poulsonii TaxID=2138 RepID=A0A2P6FD18_9MOLU|nr:hypothetical protein [Spiroplasma poulsonii]KAF0850981.1 plectrovirus-related protein [Spiroplasma poulsonii]PQM31351.1 hypothetical protein SMSRO_SF011720 [Spiroplasma poulsonii]PWF96357.1 hypothetical protein SMSE_18040 [Spiroplasma poulsonii]PWF99134.1 hypothetical protein SMH99_17060 [Spiroplasma poulsonii]
MERKYYFILRSLVTKYGKDNVINTVNNIRLLAIPFFIKILL